VGRNCAVEEPNAVVPAAAATNSALYNRVRFE